ncbi:hypothetical protein FRC00_008085 [Tulasnella sp. 408]|nr:hypothetical protein FRC00_008085 [Tulasnella sp. 408]
MINALLYRCGRAVGRHDLIVLNQFIFAANSQAIIAIAITPPQHNAQRSQKFALASMVVTLVAILTAMVSSSADVNQSSLAADRKLDDGIKLSALAMTLVALVLFIIAIVTIQSA